MLVSKVGGADREGECGAARLALCSFVLCGSSLLVPRTDAAPLVLAAPERLTGRSIAPYVVVSTGLCL